MIEAFRIGVQMTMDAADIQSTVASLARDFTSFNQQITQSQNGLSAVRAGLIDLAGQQKSLQRDQGIVQDPAIWQAAVGLPRTVPMATPAPAVHSQEPIPSAGLAAVMAPGSIARGVDDFQPNRRSEGILPDPATAVLPSLATLLSRSDPRSTAISDLGLPQRSALMDGGGFSRWDLSAWPAAYNGVPPGERSLFEAYSARLAGVGGFKNTADPSLDNSPVSAFSTAAHLNDHSEGNTSALKYVSQSLQPAEGAYGSSDTGTAAMLARAVAQISADLTDGARLMTAIPGAVAPALPPDHSYRGIAPAPANETKMFLPERQEKGASEDAGMAAASDASSASEVPSLVIHTDVHLDGQVIAQAVTQQIVDWMNGPLAGAGGFDPRRSYTPVES